MNRIEEVETADGCIKLPKEFIVRFKQKTYPVEDLIGCVKTSLVNIEKLLDEREEEKDTEIKTVQIIEEWGVELDTSSALKIEEAKIEGLEIEKEMKCYFCGGEMKNGTV